MQGTAASKGLFSKEGNNTAYCWYPILDGEAACDHWHFCENAKGRVNYRVSNSRHYILWSVITTLNLGFILKVDIKSESWRLAVLFFALFLKIGRYMIIMALDENCSDYRVYNVIVALDEFCSVNKTALRYELRFGQHGEILTDFQK